MWPVDRDNLLASVRLELSDEQADTEQQSFSDTDINDKLDSAYREVALRVSENVDDPEETLALVAGQAFYALLSTPASRLILTVRIKPKNGTAGLSGLSLDRVLTGLSERQAREMINSSEWSADEPAKGRALWWWPEPRNVADDEGQPYPRIGIWPVADATEAAASSITFRVSSILTNFVNGDSLVQLPPGCDKAIIYKVTSELAEIRGDAGFANRMEGRYEKAMTIVDRFASSYEDVGFEEPIDLYNLL